MTDPIDALLDAALARPPAERGAFLDAACGDDAARRARVERCSSWPNARTAFSNGRRWLVAASTPPSPASAATLVAGDRVGAFRIVRCLGAGGMGEVWLAERVEGGFSQQVAIKCLRGDTAPLLARFEAERLILASLEHPGIARLYDGGVTAHGRPHMVLEYVEGEDLLTWCRRSRAGLDLRLSLFLDICDAVAYAHTQLVIHRDFGEWRLPRAVRPRVIHEIGYPHHHRAASDGSSFCRVRPGS